MFCSAVPLPEVSDPVGPKVAPEPGDKPSCGKQESVSGIRIPDITTVYFKKTFEELTREVSHAGMAIDSSSFMSLSD